MSVERQTVRIFTLPQEFPCGQDSTCCGPIGQTDEEIAALRTALEELSSEVEVHSVKNQDVVQSYPSVVKLLHTFGMGAVPIITIGGQIVKTGPSSIREAVQAVEAQLASS